MPSRWSAVAIRLRLNYHGLDDGDVAKFSAERGGLHLSVTCRPDTTAHRWNVVIAHTRFPRGVSIVHSDAPEAAGRTPVLITGDESFDRRVCVLAGGAGVLALLGKNMRQKTLQLFSETRARISRARIEFEETTREVTPVIVGRHIDLGMWIGRRLAHPLTLSGLVDNVLEDPNPEVRMANLRMLALVDPEALERFPKEAHGLDLTELIRRARLEALAAGRLSIAPLGEEGALSRAAPSGSLSYEEYQED